MTDTLLAVVLCALTVGMVADAGLSYGLLRMFAPWEQTCWSLAFVVPLALRRFRPQAGALLFVALALAHLAFGPVLVLPDLFAPLMVYSVVAYGEPRRTRWFLVLACAMDVVASLAVAFVMNAGPLSGRPAWYPPAMGVCASPADGPGWLTRSCAVGMAQYAATMAMMVAACLVGAVVMAYWQRARMATVRALRERNAAIVAGEAEQRRIAASAERARIARDMHDVVAHTLSIIIVQSDGGRYAGVHDPAVARSTMETIRRESTRALHDMRGLFGAFGGQWREGYSGVGALVGQAHAALAPEGGSVVRRVEGEPRPRELGGATGEAAYRLVQEALTNVRKYAGPGAHAEVVEQWGGDGLRLTVRDDGRGAAAAEDGHAPGYGLLGMRERMAAVGGQVQAGPRPGGGFEVRAVLPLRGGAGSASMPADASTAATAPSAPPVPSPRTDGAEDAGADGRTSAGPSASRRPSSPAWRSRLAGMPRGLAAALRSRPLPQTDGSEHRLNPVERLARWTQRHYLAVDVLTALALLWMLWGAAFSGAVIGRGVWYAGDERVWLLIVLGTVAPLAFRRRFPEGSAAFAAAFGAVQLLFFPSVYFCSALVLASAYAAVLYGRPTAWRWVSVAVVAEACLFGVKAVSDRTALITLVLPGMGAVAPAELLSTLVSGTLLGVMSVGMLGLGTVAMARWARSRGTNALVLRQREEALRAEQERLKVAAANLERERIGETIQEGVAATLTGVIAQAEAGLRMLDGAAARGVQPSCEQIAGAFASIGRQGRAALAHMRRLLGVLRQTGASDAGHPQTQEAAPLAPAAPLDEQLHRIQDGRPGDEPGTSPRRVPPQPEKTPLSWKA